MRVASSISLAALLVVSCGGDYTSVPLNECAARVSVTQFSKLATAMTEMNGLNGFKAVDALDSDQNSIFVTDAPHPCVADGTVPMGTGVFFSAECASTSCKFGWASVVYPLNKNFDATIDRDGDAMTVAMSYDEFHSPQTGGTSVRTDGSVTLTDTTLDGMFQIHGEEPGLDLPPQWTSDLVLEYRSVRLDAQGCPIGGSVHAVLVSEGDKSLGTPENIEGEVSFGPGCGELSPATAMAP